MPAGAIFLIPILVSKSDQEQEEKRKNHATKETEFLRLKRTRLGKDDFDPMVVIGRGAFGEVWPILSHWITQCGLL